MLRSGRRPAIAATPRHEWIVAAARRDQVAIAERSGRADYTIDAHRNHRGPFGAAGTLVGRLFERCSVAATRAAVPRLVTLLAVAPELRATLSVPVEVERSFAFSREGNRRSWPTRIAHGVVDFVLDCVAGDDACRATILFYGVDEADALDLLFISLLLRRADPAVLLVRVASARRTVPALLSHAVAGTIRIAARKRGRADDLADATALGSCSDLFRPPQDARDPTQLAAASLPTTTVGLRTLAMHYVANDCADDDPLARAAYATLDPADHHMLHRERIAVLQRDDTSSVALGALPFHYEQAGAGPELLAAASHRCMHLAWYEAALDWAVRSLALCESLAHAPLIGEMMRNRIFALLLLERYEDVEALCARCLVESDDPALLSHACYAQAILHARLHQPPRRDYRTARRWIERALEFTARLPASEVRATNIAFLRNTLALVETRCGDAAAALRLLSDAIAYLGREAPASFAVESVILLHNRARLHRARGDVAAAVADLTTVLELEPSNAEALFDRGLLHQDAGRHMEAIRDYDAAVLWAPPDVGTFLNRARSLGALGRWEDALADYDRLLAIDPDDVRALTDRACIRRARGEIAARADVDHGLSLDPGNARLLCVRGLLELAEGALDAALASLNAVVAADPHLADAWANRAIVAHRLGRHDDALRDLDHALTLRDDSVVRRNRDRILASHMRNLCRGDGCRSCDLSGRSCEADG